MCNYNNSEKQDMVKRSRWFVLYFNFYAGGIEMQSAGKRRMFIDPEMTAL